MSIDRCMNKEDVEHIYIYNGISLGHKKDEIMSFTPTWMDLEIVTMNEVSQAKKEK